MDQDPIQPAEPIVQRTRWHVSVVWIVPIICALIGLSLIARHFNSAGPTIRVRFQTAEGLETGKTQVKYKDVPIGTVTRITVGHDMSHVTVTIDLQRFARDFARSDTRFWVVRPRIGVGGISGIGTLLSGAYIGADPGKGGHDEKNFTGLELPPAITSESHGTEFTLHSADLGSLELGSPVYYRRLRVGKVVSYTLDPDGLGVTIGVFIDSPNDRFVTRFSRFWNASGIDLSLGADGLKLSTQSLASVAAGGLAFFNPDWSIDDRRPAAAGTRFELLKDEARALEKPRGEPIYVSMTFGKSLRGLSINAPVEFVGVEIGKVVSVAIDYNAKTHRFPIIVGAVIYPERLARVLPGEKTGAADEGAMQLAALMSEMVPRGLRAQARSGNLLTGQLFISIDFLPQAPKVAFNAAQRPLQIPTAAGALDNLQEQIAGIVAKLGKIPIESIGRQLDLDLGELHGTLSQVNTELLPEAARTLTEARKTFGAASDTLTGDSPLRQNFDQTLKELQRTARSLRSLADYLATHPEALILGKRADAKPTTNPPAPSPPDAPQP